MKKAIAVLAALFSFGYFLPGAIATCRGQKNATAIWVLNLFTGFTGVGWVAALVWSFIK
jgi:hypothetical protein